MKTMAIANFKAHALQVLGEVASSREGIVVTKRGKPLVEVVPFSESKPAQGKLDGTLVFENDIVSPLGEGMWDACK